VLALLYSYWKAWEATLGGLPRTLELLSSLLHKAYFAKVTWHAQSPSELTICEAYFVRLALCVLNLATQTLRGLLYVYFSPLQSLLLNLAKLCEANFAHKKCRRAYFAGSLCEVTLHGRNVAEIALQCLLCLYFYKQALRVNLARLTLSALTLDKPTLQGLLCKVNSHSESLGDLTTQG
jgi:hypothetical protein